MGLGVLCPGQGSQGPGMFDLLAADEAAQRVLAEASAAFGQDLRALAKASTEIHRNRIAQPLLCATEAATWAALKPHLPAPRVFAGYSVGELAAYGCAGALSVTQLVELARRRALLMDEASRTPGGLVAVRGLRRPQIDQLCHRFGAQVAIVNGIDRFVIGGGAETIAALQEAASALGGTVNSLPVEVAAHTSTLAAASEGFGAELAASGMVAPVVPVLAGVHGMPVYTRDDAIVALSRQISTTIDWSACLTTLAELGCTALLELGPGRALSRMARDAFPDLPARSVADFRSFPGVIDWVTNHL